MRPKNKKNFRKREMLQIEEGSDDTRIQSIRQHHQEAEGGASQHTQGLANWNSPSR